jgi:hypothetical protein
VESNPKPMNEPLRTSAEPGVELAISKGRLARALRAAGRSQVHGAEGGSSGWTAVYTLSDPREVRRPRYVGQTRDPRRRYAQHVHTARLWLPDSTPWWVRSAKHRPLYSWLRALHRDGGRLPFMWVVEWLDPSRDPLVAERTAIMQLLTQHSDLLNAEARGLGAQLPLL